MRVRACPARPVWPHVAEISSTLLQSPPTSGGEAGTVSVLQPREKGSSVSVDRARRVAVAALACLLATACTTADPERRDAEPSPSAAPSSSAPPKPVTIDVAVYGPRGSLPGYDELGKAFEKEYPHVTVDVTRYDDARHVMAAVRGSSPPDVFLMDNIHLPQLVEDDAVRPVDALMEQRQVDFGDGFQRAGLTAFAADASLQCMPHDVSPVVVYYNRDLVDIDRLAEEGEEPPTAVDGWTWEMFAKAARQASRGPADGLYIEPSLFSLAPFLWSAGADIVDDPQDPTRLTLSEGETKDTLAQVLSVVRDPEVTPTRSELRRKSPVRRFAEGKLGMILGDRDLTPRLRAAKDLDFEVMPLPGLARMRTVADMTGYCISSRTDALQAAGDFLAFAVSEEGATITTRSGHVVPANLEVANSPAFIQDTQKPENAFVFNQAVRRVQTLPFVPTWPELTARIEPMLTRLFYAPVIDLDALLTQIDTTSEEVLAPAEEPEGDESDEGE